MKKEEEEMRKEIEGKAERKRWLWRESTRRIRERKGREREKRE